VAAARAHGLSNVDATDMELAYRFGGTFTSFDRRLNTSSLARVT